MNEPPLAGGHVLGREVVLASAGSGKTYRLSSRLIGLLAIGVAPEEILASTFTRKAAGEIMDRVLLRLAEGASDPASAQELAESMPAGVPPERLTQEGCSDLLSKTAGELHRLQVVTLDAFFFRVARAFALELGLPQSWKLAQDFDRSRLCSRAIESALRAMPPRALAELVRGAGQGVADRAVHRLLLEGVEQLHGVFRALDPAVRDPWGVQGDPDGTREVDLERLDEVIALLEDTELPKTAAGKVDSRWEKARAEGIAALRAGDWTRFLTAGLAKAILASGGTYAKKPVPDAIREILASLIRVAKVALLAEHNRRIAALGRFLPEYDRRIQRIEREEGLYHFEDLTHALSRMGQAARSEELFYRLDRRIRHLLLDEFQDTSHAQWAALAPLSEEILSGHEPDRALFIVADPKQSIYGWRGGEPRILEHVQETLGLKPQSVSQSWRSSSVVLDVVNRVFENIEDSEVLSTEREIMGRWARAFDRHHAARDLPGYVRVEVGPAEERAGRRSFRPALLSHAAAEVARLHRAAPGATIGILTRTNRSAAYLFAHLRRAGLDASEEGGVPVADSGPVLAILALLRMVDHPGDTISRYLVRMTPAGLLLGLSPEEWMDDEAVTGATQQVRRRLLSEGYGRVLSGWVRALAGEVSARDSRRLRQLTELAFRWDERATSRPSDFVTVARAARAEDPASAAVRVMTIHGAKGLEFDAVVLPDLDGLSLSGGRNSPYMALRSGGTGPVKRVFPRLKQELLPLFPDLAEAASQERESELRDGLSSLYVGLTRARHAIYAYLSPDPRNRSKARTAARVIRQALAPDVAAEAGSVLFAKGSSDWWCAPGADPKHVSPEASGRPAQTKQVRRLTLTPSPGRRIVPHRAPSELVGRRQLQLDRLLRPEMRGLRDRGIVVHLWLGSIEWIERGLPGDDELLSAATELVPRADQLPELLESFHRWVRSPEIRRLLSREAFPPGTRVERELPFVARDGDGLIEGRADRVLYIPAAAGPRLVIVDWKTEAVDPGDPYAVAGAVEQHRPQVEAYMCALATTEGLAPDRVEGVLGFVAAGIVRSVSPPS